MSSDRPYATAIVKRSEIATKYDIIIDDFSIVNFRFSQQFEQAIESKQTAEQ